MSNNPEIESTNSAVNPYTLEGNDIELKHSELLDAKMIKITEREGRIEDYVLTTNTYKLSEMYPGVKTKIRTDKIDEVIEDVLDLADELLEDTSNVVVRENLLESLSALLNDLWEMRNIREKGFAKLIVLIQAVTNEYNIDTSNIQQIEALARVLRTLKNPYVVDIDIKDCTKIMTEAGLDFYRPLIKRPNCKITIQDEKEE